MMLEIPWTLVGGFSIVTFGGWFLVYYLVKKLFDGTMCTGRELAEKNSELEAIKITNRELHKQNELLLTEWLPTANNLLNAIRTAAEGKRL